MRRTWIIVGLIITTTAASAAIYQRSSHRKEFHYAGTRLMANLGDPDAVIRTASLSSLPRDLLKVPIARDVLTEDLAFYYEQHEDRLGLNGAIKRIAYEHKLDWTDRILASALNEPAEIALWRDGKGALRHYAIVMRRGMLSKVLQQAATVALKDTQLKRAKEIDIGSGKATVLALELNPRRTLLLITQDDRIVVLSDPGLLFDSDNKVVTSAQTAIAEWFKSEGVLARKFSLDDVKPESSTTPTVAPAHTLAVGSPTLALGYGAFVPGFKGLRFDFGNSGNNGSTSVWVDQKNMPATGFGDSALWRAAPANPSACVLLPIDWGTAQTIVNQAGKKPQLPKATSLAALNGAALACWYGESTLYSPVFIVRLTTGLADRNAVLQALASWALGQRSADDGTRKDSGRIQGKSKSDLMVWRAANRATAKTPPTVAARGDYVVFSPDGALVDLVLDTLARSNPSVADQMPTSSAMLALMTPRRLSAMAEQEILAALSGEASLRAAAQTHLPARMKALAKYPPYRLELTTSTGKSQSSGWQRVEWRTPEEGK